MLGSVHDRLAAIGSTRHDEFSLSCLLALHRHQAMLTYSYEQSCQAALMGIAADYPHQAGST